MATARVIPDIEQAWTINFTLNGSTLTVSPEAVIVQPGDHVTFTNLTGSTGAISITFAANPPGVSNPPGPVLFQNISNLQPGQSQTQQAPVGVNGSVNYFVSAGGQNLGPYAIQSGSGPLYIQITNSFSSPDPAMVPKSGTLAIYSNDSNTYNISWPTLNPFPGLRTAVPGAANNIAYQQQGVAQGYAYSFSTGITAGAGGGTVKVKST